MNCFNCKKRLTREDAKYCRSCYYKFRPRGKSHPDWKGDKASYVTKHLWVRDHKGTPNKCEKCGTTKAKRYEWANISGKYKRELDDYRRLCISCHRKEGFDRGEYKSWIKGTHRQTNTGRTHIKKGQRIGVKTEFIKDQKPWNKYLTPIKCKRCQKEFQPNTAKRKYCSQKCYWNQ